MKVKKHYQVTLITVQPFTEGEDFMMHRGFESKTEAENAAKVLSSFIPYEKYPTTIELEEYDLNGNTLINKKVIKRYHLKDEDGQIV